MYFAKYLSTQILKKCFSKSKLYWTLLWLDIWNTLKLQKKFSLKKFRKTLSGNHFPSSKWCFPVSLDGFSNASNHCRNSASPRYYKLSRHLRSHLGKPGNTTFRKEMVSCRGFTQFHQTKYHLYHSMKVRL